MACFTLTAISDENAEVVLAMGGCSFDALGDFEERVFDCHQSALLLVMFWQPANTASTWTLPCPRAKQTAVYVRCLWELLHACYRVC